MGRFDEFDAVLDSGFAAYDAPPKPQEAPRTECPPFVLALIRAAQAIPNAPSLKTRAYRLQLVRALEATGWKCRTHVKVHARGTDDGYAGVLDLVAHPPAAGSDPLAIPPVLVEIDKASIQRKTPIKLGHWEGPCAGKVILLTRASSHPAVEGLDAVVPLA